MCGGGRSEPAPAPAPVPVNNPNAVSAPDPANKGATAEKRATPSVLSDTGGLGAGQGDAAAKSPVLGG